MRCEPDNISGSDTFLVETHEGIQGWRISYRKTCDKGNSELITNIMMSPLKLSKPLPGTGDKSKNIKKNKLKH